MITFPKIIRIISFKKYIPYLNLNFKYITEASYLFSDTLEFILQVFIVAFQQNNLLVFA